jgi:hypothetical protein
MVNSEVNTTAEAVHKKSGARVRFRRPKQLPAAVSIALLIALCPASHAIFERKSTEQRIAEADTILHGRVLKTDSQWVNDARGNHIYTSVTLETKSVIKGAAGPLVTVQVVGGTVGGVTEHVSGSAVFQPGDEAVLFMKNAPLRLSRGPGNRLAVVNGQVLLPEGNRVAVEDLAQYSLNGSTLFVVPPSGGKKGPPEGGTTNSAVTGPVITSISPWKASAGTNSSVTITGGGFGWGGGRVEFFVAPGEVKISAPISSWTDAQIVCTVPVGLVSGYDATAGSGPVTVVTALGAVSPAYSYYISFGYGLVRWPNGTVVNFFVNENTADCVGEAAAVVAAASAWNSAAWGIVLNYAGAHPNMASSRNGRNEIMWGGTEGSIATSTWWTYGATLLECDILCDDYYYWSTAAAPPSYGMDVQSIVLHEMGHWLSLRDLYGNLHDGQYDTGKVMYGYFSNGLVRRALHSDDRAGIGWIYGARLAGTALSRTQYVRIGSTAVLDLSAVVCYDYASASWQVSFNYGTYFSPYTMPANQWSALFAYDVGAAVYTGILYNYLDDL